MQNASSIPRYEIFELSFQHNADYKNPFFDLRIEVTFESPSGRKVKIGGFFYGSSERPQIRIKHRAKVKRARYIYKRLDLWKARFSPDELGLWRYRYRLTNIRGQKAEGRGSFRCVLGPRLRHGPVRRHPKNPFRWIFQEGTPFFPVGLQEGWGHWSCTGTCLDTKSLEGPFRTDLPNPPKLPAGSVFVGGPSYDPLNADIYCRRYRDAGFNLYRFSQRNNTFDLYKDLNHYLIHEAVMTDEILSCLRRYGFTIFYGLFGFRKAHILSPTTGKPWKK